MFSRTVLLRLTLAAVTLFAFGCSEQSTDPGTAVTGVADGDDYCIAGTVFMDTDADGVQDFDEEGVPNVTVVATDGEGGTFTERTDASGDYKFLLPEGTYTVEVGLTPFNDPPSDNLPDFNETLLGQFIPTTPTSCPVSIPPDTFDKNFGFDLDLEGLTVDLENGVVKSNGQPKQAWMNTVLLASKDNGKGKKKGKLKYDSAMVLVFLQCVAANTTVPELQFTPGSEFEEALAILKINNSAPLVEQTLAELLTAELNGCAGLGIVGVSGLQNLVIINSEVVVNSFLNNGGTLAVTGVMDVASDPEDNKLSSTKLCLSELNRGGGGGSVQ